MRSYTDSVAQRANENRNVAKIGLVSRQAHNMALSIFEDFDLITFIKVRNTYKAVLKRPFKNIRCDYIVKDTSTFNRQAEVELLIPIDFVTYFWKKFPHKLWALKVPFLYCGNDEIVETLNKIRNDPRNEGAKDCLKNVFENNKTTLKHVDDEFGTAIALKLIPPNLRLQTYYIDAWKCYAKKFIRNRDDSRAFEIEMMPHASLVRNNIDERSSIPKNCPKTLSCLM
uniref:Uncharacterized protein n=1 Tax=Acrobeloides nanus TaxID=290746 RepID=A0A914DWR8_9BILA